MIDNEILKHLENPNVYFIQRIGKKIRLARLHSKLPRSAILEEWDMKKESDAIEIEDLFGEWNRLVGK